MRNSIRSIMEASWKHLGSILEASWKPRAQMLAALKLNEVQNNKKFNRTRSSNNKNFNGTIEKKFWKEAENTESEASKLSRKCFGRLSVRGHPPLNPRPKIS